MATNANKLILIGGNGQLGKVVLKKFVSCKVKPWNVTCIDFSNNNEANANFNISEIMKTKDKNFGPLYDFLGTNKYDSIITVAGGWEGTPLDSLTFIQSIENMFNMNFLSASLAAHLASKFLKENSLLLLTGASVVKKNELDCTSMLTYQLSKQSVFNLTDTLTKYPKLLPNGTKIVNLCPGVIDTPTNRKYMGDQDTSKWVKPGTISDYLKQWSDDPSTSPKSIYHHL
jgi:NAD(P)-dependent dehydrogenase (short-subunit alcohol dehydrogenase family)